MVTAQVCNRGAATLPRLVPVAVYSGAKPTPGKAAACTTKGQSLLKPGACETVSCAISPAPQAKTDLYVVANDDGSGSGHVVECQGKNNWALIKGAHCP